MSDRTIKTEQDTAALELKIALFLRYGVLFSGSLMLAGWIALFDFKNNPLREFSRYQRLPLGNILALSIDKGNWGLLVAYLGLIALIALPTLRVFLTCILFIRSRDFLLAAVAGFVLLVLIFSFCLGLET
jgi:uncharacterized membrane protein